VSADSCLDQECFESARLHLKFSVIGAADKIEGSLVIPVNTHLPLVISFERMSKMISSASSGSQRNNIVFCKTSE
jgi:hypothetical protein